MATAKDYTDSLFTAIKNISNASIVDVSNYDSTKIYTIIEDMTKTHKGGYKVSNQKVEIIAYAMNDATYSIGDSVYVLVTADKNDKNFILGSSSISTLATSYINPLRKLVILKSGSVDGTLSINENNKYLELDIDEILPKFLQAPNSMRADTDFNKMENLYINIQASFKNTKDAIFKLKIEALDNENKVDKTAYWSCEDMVGNYKNFMVPFKQEKTFQFIANKIRIRLVKGDNEERESDAEVSNINYFIGFDQSVFKTEGILIGSDHQRQFDNDTNVQLETYWIRKDSSNLFYRENSTSEFEDRLKKTSIEPNKLNYTTEIIYNTDETAEIKGSNYNSLSEEQKNIIDALEEKDSTNEIYKTVKDFNTKISFEADFNKELNFYSNLDYKLTLQLNCAEGDDFAKSITAMPFKIDLSEVDNDGAFLSNILKEKEHSISKNEETLFYDLSFVLNFVGSPIAKEDEVLELDDDTNIYKYQTQKIKFTLISNKSTLNRWGLFEGRSDIKKQQRDKKVYIDNQPEYYLRWYKMNPKKSSGWERIADKQYNVNVELDKEFQTQTYKCVLTKNNLLAEDNKTSVQVEFKNKIQDSKDEENTKLKTEQKLQINTLEYDDGKEYSENGNYYIYDEGNRSIDGQASKKRYMTLNATGNSETKINDVVWYFPYADQTMVRINETEILQMTDEKETSLLWAKIDSLEKNDLAPRATNWPHTCTNANPDKDDPKYKYAISCYGPYFLTQDNEYKLSFWNLPTWEEIKNRNFRIDICKSIGSCIDKKEQLIDFSNSLNSLYSKTRTKNNDTEKEKYMDLKLNGIEFTPPEKNKDENRTSLFTSNKERNFYIIISYQRASEPNANETSYIKNTKVKVGLVSILDTNNSYIQGTSKIRTIGGNKQSTIYFGPFELIKGNKYGLCLKDLPQWEQIKDKNVRIDLILDNNTDMDKIDSFSNTTKNLYTKNSNDQDTEAENKYNNLKCLSFSHSIESGNYYVMISQQKTVNNNTNYFKDAKTQGKVENRIIGLYSNGQYKKRYRAFKYIGPLPNTKDNYTKAIKEAYKIPFSLKNSYDSSYSLNTIKCKINNNKELSKELTFGRTNISGTECGINIVYADEKREYIWYDTNKKEYIGDKGKGQQIGFRVELINSNGTKIDKKINVKIVTVRWEKDEEDKTYKWITHGDSDDETITVDSNVDFYIKPDYYDGYNVMKASCKIDDMTLTAKFPLIFFNANTNELKLTGGSSTGRLNYILGPTEVIYNNSGQLLPNQNFGPYRLVTSTGAKLNSPILKEGKNEVSAVTGKNISSYTIFNLNIKDSELYLSVPNIWYTSMSKVYPYIRLQNSSDNETPYKIYIPIIIKRDMYTIDKINKWNGKYGDGSNDDKFFPYLGVGSENSKGEFTGVYIGQSGKTEFPISNSNETKPKNWWGIIGMKNNKLTFGLNAETGDAYFSGEVQASSGDIGRWAIKPTYLLSSLIDITGSQVVTKLQATGQVAAYFGLAADTDDPDGESKKGFGARIFHNGRAEFGADYNIIGDLKLQPRLQVYSQVEKETYPVKVNCSMLIGEEHDSSVSNFSNLNLKYINQILGSPTFSGNPTFSGSPKFTGKPTFSSDPTFSGSPKFTGNITGSPTFSGSPKFTGSPTFSGSPKFNQIIGNDNRLQLYGNDSTDTTASVRLSRYPNDEYWLDYWVNSDHGISLNTGNSHSLTLMANNYAGLRIQNNGNGDLYNNWTSHGSLNIKGDLKVSGGFNVSGSLKISDNANLELYEGVWSGTSKQVGIIKSKPEGYLQGSWSVDNPTDTWSDINKKNTINPINDSYSILFDNLCPVTFKYNEGTSNRFHIGFIAQQVKESLDLANLTTQEFAGLVIHGLNTDNTLWSLRYEEFIALNTNEIQKLKKRVNQLESEVSSLKEQLLNINN